MPPKKAPAPAAVSEETIEEKNKKIIEDKTFGLKNKKGAKQQRLIAQIKKHVKGGVLQRSLPKTDKRTEKEKKLQEPNELAVETQKTEIGTDL